MPGHDGTTAHDALRAATREVHERLHLVPCFAALAAGRLDRAGYVALLGRLFGFHCPVEDWLAAALAPAGAALAPSRWRRAGLLRDDLAALGVGADAIAGLPRAPPPPALDTPDTLAAALGVLYVAEGSTLGGRVLARTVAPMLGHARDGRSFLLAGADPARLRWTEVIAAIDRYGAEPARRTAMAAAAQDAFARFEAWFATPSPQMEQSSRKSASILAHREPT